MMQPLGLDIQGGQLTDQLRVQMHIPIINSAGGRFVVVHNGIIENYEALKKDFLTEVTLQSDTDTEVVVQVIEEMFKRTGSTLRHSDLH